MGLLGLSPFFACRMEVLLQLFGQRCQGVFLYEISFSLGSFH